MIRWDVPDEPGEPLSEVDFELGDLPDADLEELNIMPDASADNPYQGPSVPFFSNIFELFFYR